MEKFLKIISACALFDGIGSEDLLKMLRCFGARVEFFDKRNTVICEGEPGNYIGIVLSGVVRIEQIDYNGNRSIIAEKHPSDTFAEEFACAEISSMPVSVVALEPSFVMLVECAHILHTCSNHCGFHNKLIYNLMKALAVNNLVYHRRMLVTSKRSTREKLLTYLTQCAKEAGSLSFDIPFDRQELADYLEVERSGLSVEIGKLRKEGLLDCYKNHFKLLFDVLSGDYE